MFKLYKGNAGATADTIRMIASGAIAEGAPVALAAGASGAELGKVVQLTGGASADEKIYGVALHAAADTAEVLVMPIRSGQVWIADTAADTNVTSVGQDNYLTATTLTLVVGASSGNGRKCRIIGRHEATGKRKLLVELGNFGASEEAVGTPVQFTYDVAADATGAPTAFTAPFAMRITDIHVIATATSGSGTILPMKGSDAICTAIACATDGAVARMAAGVDDTKLTLAAGDVVKVDANGSTDRGIVVFTGYRL
jgi:hypothetical protein